MSVFVLNESQKGKLDNLKANEVVNNEKVTKELLNVWKIVQGKESETNFQYEYDELFDEYDEVCKVSLDEFVEIAPTIYHRIGKTKGEKIYKAITKGKFTDELTREVNVNNKIKKIEEDSRIPQRAKEKAIENRKIMLKEANKLKKKGVEVTKNICWKIWRIEEGKRAEEFVNKDQLPKNIAKVEYLGKDFMTELKKEKYGK